MTLARLGKLALLVWLLMVAWVVFRPVAPPVAPPLPWREVSPTVSGDGSMVAFEIDPVTRDSAQPSAFGRQTETPTQIALVDSLTNRVETIARSQGSCFSPSLSGDGKKLVFCGENGPSFLTEVFVADTKTLKFERVECSWRKAGHGGNFSPTISSDGERMAFISHQPYKEPMRAWTPALTVSEVNAPRNPTIPFNWRVALASGPVALSPTGARMAWENRFLRPKTDILEVRLLAFSGRGAPFTLERDAGEPALSTDRCAYVVPDKDGVYQIALYDFESSSKRTLTSGNDDSLEPSLSDDGRWLVFTSYAGNLVEGDRNGQSDVFLMDLESGSTTCLSLRGDGASYNPDISADGSTVVFASLAGNLGPHPVAPGQVYLWKRDRPTCRALPTRTRP